MKVGASDTRYPVVPRALINDLLSRPQGDMEPLRCVKRAPNSGAIAAEVT